MTLKMESALKSPPVIGSLVYMTKSLLPLLGHDYLSTEVLLLQLTTFSLLYDKLLFIFILYLLLLLFNHNNNFII